MKLTALLIVMTFLVFANTAAADPAANDADVKPGTGVRTIYLIRHGHYDVNDDSDPDVGRALVPLGIAQARLVAARLRAMPVEITSIYCSTMTRARQTAAVINEELPGLEVQKTRLLRECTPPTWREDVMADLEEGEAEDCRAQLEEAFAKFFVPSPDRDANDVLVCHGNVIRYFVTKVLGVDTMSWLRMSIGNCSLTAVRINPNGTMKLLYFSDVGHLPPNMYTQTGDPPDAHQLVVPLE